MNLVSAHTHENQKYLHFRGPRVAKRLATPCVTHPRSGTPSEDQRGNQGTHGPTGWRWRCGGKSLPLATLLLQVAWGTCDHRGGDENQDPQLRVGGTGSHQHGNRSRWTRMLVAEQLDKMKIKSAGSLRIARTGRIFFYITNSFLNFRQKVNGGADRSQRPLVRLSGLSRHYCWITSRDGVKLLESGEHHCSCRSTGSLPVGSADNPLAFDARPLHPPWYPSVLDRSGDGSCHTPADTSELPELKHPR